MKEIFKKLTANRATLTKVVFVVMFFTLTTAVPVHKAEASFWDNVRDMFDGGGFGGSGDDHCVCSHDDYVANGGTDSRGGSDDGLHMNVYRGDYVGARDTISGFNNSADAMSAANDLAAIANANDNSGTVYGSSVSYNSDGSYTASVRVVHAGGGGGGGGGHTTPSLGTVYGEIFFYGHLYAGRNNICPDGTASWEPACNSSCTALTGWACDTVPHTDPVTIGIYVDGVLYDTLQPTIRNSRNNHCGSSLDNLNDYRYPTPLAWKDGVPRTVTIRATRPSDNLSVNLVHAPWNGPTSFQVTCPVPLLPTIDLTGILGTVADQIKDVPFAVDTVIKNQGTLAATSSIKVYLQFDYGDDGWHLDTNGDFRIISTVNALGIGDQVNHTFPDITIPKIGDWKVRLMVDPGYLVEPGTSLYQSNNKTSWVSFFVNNPPSTAPELTFWADPPSVRKGPTATTTLTWIGFRIEPNTCIATGSWTGNNMTDRGHQTVLVGNEAGNKTYRLTCTGTDGTVISRTVSVNVTNTTSTSGITINFWVTQNIIRSGESAKINWDINVPAGYTALCESTGLDDNGTFDVIERNSENVNTPILTNTQVFTITCTPNSPDIETVSKSVTVEVIPVAQEV